jgi:hypothetical protein
MFFSNRIERGKQFWHEAHFCTKTSKVRQFPATVLKTECSNCLNSDQLRGFSAGFASRRKWRIQYRKALRPCTSIVAAMTGVNFGLDG